MTTQVSLCSLPQGLGKWGFWLVKKTKSALFLHCLTLSSMGRSSYYYFSRFPACLLGSLVTVFCCCWQAINCHWRDPFRLTGKVSTGPLLLAKLHTSTTLTIPNGWKQCGGNSTSPDFWWSSVNYCSIKKTAFLQSWKNIYKMVSLLFAFFLILFRFWEYSCQTSRIPVGCFLHLLCLGVPELFGSRKLQLYPYQYFI